MKFVSEVLFVLGIALLLIKFSLNFLHYSARYIFSFHLLSRQLLDICLIFNVLQIMTFSYFWVTILIYCVYHSFDSTQVKEDVISITRRSWRQFKHLRAEHPPIGLHPTKFFDHKSCDGGNIISFKLFCELT